MSDWTQHEIGSAPKANDMWGESAFEDPHGSHDDGSWKDSGVGENNAWGGGADLTEKPIDKTAPPKSSAKAAENVARTRKSQWNLDSLEEALYEESENVPNPGAVMPATGVVSIAVLTANDQMRLGNGSGYEASKPEFAFQAKKYEWKDEYGDVGPEVPELERDLYDDKFLNKAGDGYNIIIGGKVEVTVESENKVDPCFEVCRSS